MMITNKAIYDIWNDMQSLKSGFYKRLLGASSTDPYFYAVALLPQKQYGIGISLPNHSFSILPRLKDFKDLNIDYQIDYTFENRSLLCITFPHQDCNDVFSVLCADLLNKVLFEKDEKKIVKTIIYQLDKWQSLFEKMRIDGLSTNEQLGLYGELVFFSYLLNNGNQYVNAVNSWVGVDKDVRDFQINNWAVEVKTSSGNNNNKVFINNIRQLDESLIENLYLYHLSIEVSKGNGETLIDIIENIRNTLKSDYEAVSLFNTKLFQFGYFEKDIELYSKRYYKKRDENIYVIKDDFPRIKESEVRSGIDDLHYSVNLSNCEQYLLTMGQVLKMITV